MLKKQKPKSKRINDVLERAEIPLSLAQSLSAFTKNGEDLSALETVRDLLHQLSPVKSMPVDRVRWVPISLVTANDYNPNSVATNEMRSLYHSIASDGYTQPTVTVWDEEIGKFVIVDGFHRYLTMKNYPDIAERTNNLLPIVVIEKDINDRMASTIRHNRARGKHSISGMANMVFEMLDNGWSDSTICNELGLEAEELVRLKHVSGFSKLFENYEYRSAWESKNQIALRLEAEGKTVSDKTLDPKPRKEKLKQNAG